MRQYHWPGNVRELNTVIERACIDAGAGKITIDNLLRFTSPKHNGNLRNKYQGFDLAKARKKQKNRLSYGLSKPVEATRLRLLSYWD